VIVLLQNQYEPKKGFDERVSTEMDRIVFNTSALGPMLDWLSERKRTREGDEERLREILALPDYKVEFERYSIPSLPVCRISFEEAVDFFMNFDRKDFGNQRLHYKKESFQAFYDELEERKADIDAVASLTEDDYGTIESLLRNGLPEELLEGLPEFNIILIVSIGNSMGWPYGHYVDFDVANLQKIKSHDDFLHIIAHELHHVLVGPLLAPEGIRGEDFFLQNFAYEGLAMHYMNNLATCGKESKYNDVVYAVDQEDMAFYGEHFDEIFEMIRRDYRSCIGKTMDEVSRMVSEHYEQFTFMGKNIRQYPTYYFGCYMWGLVDLRFGKERMYESIAKPQLFVPLYNSVAEEKYRL